LGLSLLGVVFWVDAPIAASEGVANGSPWRPIVDPFKTLALGCKAVSEDPSHVSFTLSYRPINSEQ
jgi:hypothetical protein